MGFGDVAIHTVQSRHHVVACVCTRQGEACDINVFVGPHIFVGKEPCGCAVEIHLPPSQGSGHGDTCECSRRGAVIHLGGCRQTLHGQYGRGNVGVQRTGLCELVIGRLATSQDIVGCDGNAGAHVGTGEGARLRQGHVIGVDHAGQNAAGHAGRGGGVIHLARTRLTRDGDVFR